MSIEQNKLQRCRCLVVDYISILTFFCLFYIQVQRRRTLFLRDTFSSPGQIKKIFFFC